jgi:hypothetical protein
LFLTYLKSKKESMRILNLFNEKNSSQGTTQRLRRTSNADGARKLFVKRELECDGSSFYSVDGEPGMTALPFETLLPILSGEKSMFFH